MVQVIKEQAICLDEFGELLISKDSVHMLIVKEAATIPICLDEFGELLISKDSVHMLIVKESDTTIGARKYRFITQNYASRQYYCTK